MTDNLAAKWSTRGVSIIVHCTSAYKSSKPGTQLQYNSALHQCSLHHQRIQEFKTQLQYTTTVHVEENATLETRCTESVSSKANCTRRRRTPVQRKTVQHSVEHVHCTAVLLHLCSACGERGVSRELVQLPQAEAGLCSDKGRSEESQRKYPVPGY